MALASLLLIISLFFPLWDISLQAPQYPEGLGMSIYAHTIKGHTRYDLQKINNLNHYIGMKPITPDSIVELKLMQPVIIFIAIGGFLVALTGNRILGLLWIVIFGILAVAGMIDFYLWEYDYGHNLDQEKAIIKIPGMSYQPPLFGTKKLLNFTASAYPGWGGIAAISAFILGAAATIIPLKRRSKKI